MDCKLNAMNHFFVENKWRLVDSRMLVLPSGLQSTDFFPYIPTKSIVSQLSLFPLCQAEGEIGMLLSSFLTSKASFKLT